MQLNIKDLLNKTEEYFRNNNLDSPRLDAEVLLADLLETDRVKLYVNFDYPLTDEQLSAYRARIKKRAQGIPVSYLTRKKEFMSLELQIEPGVLIPRPETEELVEKVLEELRGQSSSDHKIVDVGTGSGAILVSLLYYLPEAKGIGIDISPQAIRVARENLKQHDLNKRAGLIEGDLLLPLLPERKGQLDLVISNPPYIPNREYKDLEQEVKSEPRNALVGGNDGLDIYRRLIPQAAQLLRPGGLLALEIGHDQGEDIKKVFQGSEADWQKVEVFQDGGGRDRIVMVRTGGER
ncbi:MAG: peptide chain release factor N(5)-glutamine methyltransferase [Bacillota bacterium]